jgi:DNA-binding MarR family transcriptional regulator
MQAKVKSQETGVVTSKGNVDLLSQCALFDVHRLGRVMTGLYNAHMKDVPLSFAQFTMVRNVEALAPARVTDVARALLTDRTSVTRLIEPLIARGLLRIEQDGEDGRVRNLTVTAKGRAALNASERAWEDAQQEFYDIVGPDKLTQLRRVLRDTIHLVREHQEAKEVAKV